MGQDNYVVRERYKELIEVDGQVVLVRGDMKPEEILELQSEPQEAAANGGGVKRSRKSRIPYGA